MVMIESITAVENDNDEVWKKLQKAVDKANEL